MVGQLQKPDDKKSCLLIAAEKLYSHRLLCAVLICFITGGIISAFSGFRFTYFSNDDYLLSLLISKGETRSLYVNYFLTNLLVFFQKLAPFLNWFTLVQQVCCFASMIVLCYVFLKKMQPVLGVAVSVFFSGFIFISNVLQVQYSQTAVLMPTAGMVLLAYAHLFEIRKSVKIVQTAISVVLFIAGALFRFTPFAVCAAFSFLFVLCVFYAKYKQSSQSSIRRKAADAFRKSLSLVIAAAIAFFASAALYLSSEVIQRSDSNYRRYIEYNNARMLVDDYKMAPYEGNEDFYNSVGINSSAELYHFVYDNEKYNARVLEKISEYSENVIQNGDSKPVYAIKQSFSRLTGNISDVFSSFKNALHLSVSDGLFASVVLFVLSAAVFICVVICLKYIKRKKIKLSFSKAFIDVFVIALWVLFFFTAKIDPYNFLFIPLAAVVICSLFFDKRRNDLACIAFSPAPMALYLYQNTFRMSYRVAYAILLPSVVYLLFLMNPIIEKPRHPKVRQIAASAVLVIGIIVPSVCLYNGYYHDNSFTHDMSLRRYVEQHDKGLFFNRILTSAYLDSGYYNALLVPSVAGNEVVLGWYQSSDYFENTLKENHIDNYMKDLINSDNRLIIEDNGTLTLEERKKTYEDFYRYHYFNGSNTVSLVLEKKFSYPVSYSNSPIKLKTVGVYKVVQISE